MSSSSTSGSKRSGETQDNGTESKAKKQKIDDILNKNIVNSLHVGHNLAMCENFLITRDINAHEALLLLLNATKSSKSEKTEKTESTVVSTVDKKLNDIVSTTLCNCGFYDGHYPRGYVATIERFYKETPEIFSCEDVIKCRRSIAELRNANTRGYEQRYVLSKMIRDLHFGVLASSKPTPRVYPDLKDGDTGAFITGDSITLLRPLYSATDEDLRAKWKSGSWYDVSIMGIGTDRNGENTYHMRYNDGDIWRHVPEDHVRYERNKRRYLRAVDRYTTTIKDVVIRDGNIIAIKVGPHPKCRTEEDVWVSTNSRRLLKSRIDSGIATYDDSSPRTSVYNPDEQRNRDNDSD